MKWVPRDPSTIFLITNCGRKMSESSDSTKETLFYKRFLTLSGPRGMNHLPLNEILSKLLKG